MAKFSNTPTKTKAPKSPIKTKGSPTVTHEGGVGYKRSAKAELFLLAATNMVGEDTFYEKAEERDERFRNLIHKVAGKDPEWLARFVPYLRNDMFMRSASVVLAAEYVRAGAPNGRSVVRAACSRADEPAELLAYWLSTYGRPLPVALKRGLADAALRLYTETSALKYDGISRGTRPADVIELTHPKPTGDWQSDLFAYLLDRRHHGDIRVDMANLPTIGKNREILAYAEAPVDVRREYLLSLSPEYLSEAGMTWEMISGFVGEMTAEVWEKIIPSMGYMALLRNLRNFDEAGISDTVANRIATKLVDPNEVAKSKQFPYRFLSAFVHAPGARWLPSLERALDLATQNIPKFSGKTLILTDTSASMTTSYSRRSTVTPAQAAALFAVAMAKRGSDTELVQYADEYQYVEISKSASVLRETERLVAQTGAVGHGTQTFQTLAKTYGDHDRVVIFTDMQAFAYRGYDSIVSKILGNGTKIYSYNLGGYETTHTETGRDGLYEFGGLSDKSFTMMKLVDEHRDGVWPF